MILTLDVGYDDDIHVLLFVMATVWYINKSFECASCSVVRLRFFLPLPAGVGSVRFCNPRVYKISYRRIHASSTELRDVHSASVLGAYIRTPPWDDQACMDVCASWASVLCSVTLNLFTDCITDTFFLGPSFVCFTTQCVRFCEVQRFASAVGIDPMWQSIMSGQPVVLSSSKREYRNVAWANITRLATGAVESDCPYTSPVLFFPL
jgi:hypothetical protein